MATVNKNFKVKSGLVVEGATGTIGGFDILTKKAADQNYIISLIGGAATSENTPDTVVLRDEFGNFAAGEITADLQGNVTGDVTGTVSSLSNHNTDGLQEGNNNLYFSDFRAQEAVADVLGSGLGWGSEGAGNVIYVDTNLISTKTYAEDVASNAQTAAQGYADTVSGNAQSAAESYAEGLVIQEVSDRNSAISTAITNLDLANTYDAKGAAATAEQNAKDYADDLINDASTTTTNVWSAYKTSTEIGLAQAAAETHADEAIAALVNGAPAVLDTLNELAEALQDNPDIISDLQDIAAGKQDTLTAGNGIDIDGSSNISVDPYDLIGTLDPSYIDLDIKNGKVGLNKGTLTNYTNTLYDAIGSADAAETAANLYTDGRETAITTAYQSYADTAEQDAKNYADGLAVNYDAAGSAAQALEDAKDYADALDTDDIAEGTAQYFTDARAKSSAKDLLINSSQTNISITENIGTGGLIITAENGVADSDTDDLTEGTTNLYFTDQRAVDALEAVVPNFTEVEINSVAKNIASTLEATTAGVQAAYAWDKNAYRSAEFLVKVAYGSHTEISKVLLTLDTSDNIAITEYGIVGTNGSASSISAGISGTDVELQVTTVNNNSTVTVMGTLLV